MILKFGLLVLDNLYYKNLTRHLYRSITTRKLNNTMKVKKSLVIFAVVFGSVFSSSVAMATNDKKVKEGVKITAVALVKGQEKGFVRFVEENFQPFSLQTEWKTIVTIVTLYNESPSKFLNTDKQTQRDFNEAVLRLNQEASHNPEAIQWLANLEKTTKSINFFWNVDWENLAEKDNTNEEVSEPVSEASGF